VVSQHAVEGVRCEWRAAICMHELTQEPRVHCARVCFALVQCDELGDGEEALGRPCRHRQVDESFAVKAVVRRLDELRELTLKQAPASPIVCAQNAGGGEEGGTRS
jgi:hypothetical protein